MRSKLGIVKIALLVGAQNGGLAIGLAAAAAPLEARVTIEPQSPASRRPLNPLLFGSNIEWTQHGDSIQDPPAFTLNQVKMARAVALHPTVIRFPGGTLSDAYRWRAGVGPMSQRGSILNPFTNLTEPATFGTVEFLTVCAQTSALPLVTINAVTATAQDAADWVRAINLTRFRGPAGTLLPKAPVWEVGNEPYFPAENPAITILPAAFIAKANAIIPAIRQVDPTILVGVPLAPDYLGRIVPAPPPYDTFNETLLAGLTSAPDFFAIHDAYLPSIAAPANSDRTIFLATMASSLFARDDLDRVRARIQARFPGATIPFALTEYNSAYSLTGLPSDGFIASPMGALYVADVLMMLAQRTDILMANEWSLLDNWYFGTVDGSGLPRPAFTVLSRLASSARGELLRTSVLSPTFDVPPIVAPYAYPTKSGVPLISALAVREGAVIRVFLINKSFNQSIEVHLPLVRLGAAVSARASEFFMPNPFRIFTAGDPALTWSPISVHMSIDQPLTDLHVLSETVAVQTKPHSIVIVELMMK